MTGTSKKTQTMCSGQIRLSHIEKHVHIEFATPRRVISSAILNGGIVEAGHIVNMKVPKQSFTTEAPEVTLKKYCATNGWAGTVVGMMTAASMDSFHMASESVQGVELAVLVTSGLSNPRRSGDRADNRLMGDPSETVGTINIIVATSAILAEPALVEAVMMVTEAKAAALQEAGIHSPVSGKTATGTGTDAVVVVGGHGPQTVPYCGKHVLFGEILGRLVLQAVTASIGQGRG